MTPQMLVFPAIPDPSDHLQMTRVAGFPYRFTRWHNPCYRKNLPWRIYMICFQRVIGNRFVESPNYLLGSQRVTVYEASSTPCRAF